MVMARSAPITNYFKKLNQAQRMKRPLPQDGREDSRESIRRKSSSSSPSAAPGVQTEGDTLTRSHRASQTNSSAHAMTSSQHAPSSQPALPNRTVSVPTPDNYVEPEQPHLPCLSPALDAALTVRESLQAPFVPTAEDITTSKAQPYTPTIPSLDTTLPRKDNIPASQTVLTSSQRIVRDGEIMIRNSDDESDDSLEDLDKLFGEDRHTRKSSSPSDYKSPYPHKKVGMKTRRKAANAMRAAESTPTLSLEPKKYKYSLEALGKQREQDEAARKEIARAQSLFESLEQRTAFASVKKRVFDIDLIDSVLKEHGDEDDIGRLRTAIHRTEALEQGKSWSFFDDVAEGPLFELADFPVVKDKGLQRLFGQHLPRQQAFLGGYAGEYAVKAGLPEEIIIWIMDAICLESRDDLRYSYISTLSDATIHFTPLLTPEYIDKLFRRLGATATAMDIETIVEPRVILSQNVEINSRPSLLSILILLGSVAGELATNSRIHLLNTFCRLALDYSLVKDCHALSALEEAFASLVASIPEETLNRELEAVLTTVYRTIRDATLRLQLIQTIPAWSSRLLLLRQRFALAFFFQDSRYSSKQPEDLVNLRSIARRLESPQFNIRKGTDFGELAASICILSIGIDCGDPPPSPATKVEDAAFNEDVDSLSSKIQSMFSDIIDTGASHMKRTEAKEVLEGFQRRLEYSIRTKPKPKKLIFGDAEVVPLQEQMDAFVKKSRRVV